MKISIAAQKLRRTNCNLFVLPIFEDERPLKKINGMVDWRLCGKISQLIIQKQFCGKLTEKLLFANLQKPIAQNIILVGLGKKKNFGKEPLHEVFLTLQGAISQLKISSFALAPENFFSNYVKLGKVMECLKDLLQFLDGRAGQSALPNLSIVLFQGSLSDEVGQELLTWKNQLSFIHSAQFES